MTKIVKIPTRLLERFVTQNKDRKLPKRTFVIRKNKEVTEDYLWYLLNKSTS